MKVRTHATASACDVQRARDFERARAFAHVDAGHAQARAESVKGLPFRLRRDLMRDWAAASVGGPAAWNKATRQLNDRARYVKNHARTVGAGAEVERIAARDTLHDYSSDGSVKAWARRRACEAQVIAGREEDEMAAVAAVRTYMQRWSIGEVHVQPPELEEDDDGQPLYGPWFARVTCRRWWTRQARRMLRRAVEAWRVDAGQVHRHAQLYVSDYNVDAGRAAEKRCEQLILDMEVEDQHGRRVPLADVAKGSVSNPWVRFSEMMVRAKGLQAIADAGGWVGWFITWTLPSRWHARGWKGGERNAAFYGDPALPVAKRRPAMGNRYLVELWAKVRAVLSNRKIKFFGMRVAEPHHDGTPHWHMMFWTLPQHVKEALRVMHAYALRESPNEPGAKKRRFKAKRIRAEQGGAAGYLMKYLVKNTTGAGLGKATDTSPDRQDSDVGEAPVCAYRARQWASTHGIRQFQTYGTPPIGTWREFRRLRSPLTIETAGLERAGPKQLELFERARATADASDYGGHVQAMGGIALRRDDYRFRLVKEQLDGMTMYGEERAPITRGIALASVASVAVLTRPDTWVLKWSGRTVPKVADSAPWTRGNNCNGVVRAAPDSPARDADSAPRPGWWDVWFPSGDTIGDVAT